MTMNIVLTINQADLAGRVIEEVEAFFVRQVEADVLDEVPELPVVRGVELFLPADVDVIWAMIHCLGSEGAGIANKIDRMLEGGIGEDVRLVQKAFHLGRMLD